MIGMCGNAELETAAAAATRAQRQWAGMTFDSRQEVLLAVLGRIQAHRAEIEELIIAETGSLRGKAEYEVSAAMGEIMAAIGLAGQPRGELLASQDPNRLSISERIPVGTVAAITPWNFPLVLAMRVIAPAIALGNAVILKPSPETPLSGGLLLAKLFEGTRAPHGLFQVLCGDQAFSEALVAHSHVDMVHFTGSSAVGREIARKTGESLRRVSLELGGNNALIVLDDADIEQAATLGAWSAFHYQGQTCISAGRHIVSSRVVDSYVKALVAKASRLRVGDPREPNTDIGPIVNTRQLSRALGLLNDSVSAGAVIETGGDHNGRFMRPTVLTHVTREMPIWTEEIFAPIAPVVTFDTDEEAIQIANESQYGLVDSVVTGSEKRGLAVADKLKAGMVHLNDATPIDEPAAPFGGVGASGLGAPSGGQPNLEAFTERKWVTVQRETPHYPF